MTCADCDLSGRCPCVMRRLERLRAKGLIPASSSASPSPAAGAAAEGEPLLSNEELFESAMQLLRDIEKS